MCKILPRCLSIEDFNKGQNVLGFIGLSGYKSKKTNSCYIKITSEKINNSIISELEEKVLVKIIDLKNYK